LLRDTITDLEALLAACRSSEILSEYPYYSYRNCIRMRDELAPYIKESFALNIFLTDFPFFLTKMNA
jgi:hypothetical protein